MAAAVSVCCFRGFFYAVVMPFDSISCVPLLVIDENVVLNRWFQSEWHTIFKCNQFMCFGQYGMIVGQKRFDVVSLVRQYPDVKPGNTAWHTFNRPLHGTSPATARPFVQPTGAHDMYHAGEYMIWTDGKTCRCKSDTAYSPADYAAAWEMTT